MLRLAWNFVFHTQRRHLTVYALALAAAARLRIVLYPGNRLLDHLGDERGETPRDKLPPEDCRRIGWVADKVNRVARRTPWESRCLVRAMVAQRMLRRYGLASTLYLGVKRDEQGAAAAHAWLRCGAYFVTGGVGGGYATVGSFVMHPRGRRAGG